MQQWTVNSRVCRQQTHTALWEYIHGKNETTSAARTHTSTVLTSHVARQEKCAKNLWTILNQPYPLPGPDLGRGRGPGPQASHQQGASHQTCRPTCIILLLTSVAFLIFRLLQSTT